MPIILSSILSFALQSAFQSTYQIDQFEIGVVKGYTVEKSYEIPFMEDVDFESDVLSDANGDKIFFDNFLDQEGIKKIMSYQILTYEEGIQKIKDNEISALVILDENFSRDIFINFVSPFRKAINIRVIKNQSRSITSNIAYEIIKGFTTRVNQMIISKNVLIELAAENEMLSSITDIESRLTSFNESLEDYNVTIKKTAVESKKTIDSRSYYSAAMLAMFLLFVAGNSSTLLLDEKRNMTYDRMIVSGISKSKILLGKYITIFSLVLLESFVMIAYSSYILNVQWGSLFKLLVVAITGAITVASFGLMISIITFNNNNRKLTVLLNSVIFQILAALGGSFIPVEALPQIMQKLRYLPFNGVILKLFLNTMQGLTIRESFFEFSILGINTLVFLIISYVLIRKGDQYAKSH
jgi:ABC-2 type transport system permease protein